MSLISKVVPERLRGIAFGLFSTSIGLIALPAPYVGAWLWEHVSQQTPFIVLVVGLVLSLPLIWFKFRLPTVREAEAVAIPAAAE